jgi:hypothetical protein
MRLSGRDVERAFSEKGQQSAVAMVFLEVDYQFAGEHWVMAAYSGEISSTELAISVIEIPRRTLLVSG